MSAYPEVLDSGQVGKYPALAKAGGGYVWDAVLEYRVWCHPLEEDPDREDGADYYFAFKTYEDALAFSRKTAGAEEPLALILQEEYIDEPETGHYTHVREKRVTEWPVEFLRRPRRTERTIPAFLAPDAPANRLDILRGLAVWLLLAAGLVWPTMGLAAGPGGVAAGGHQVEVVDGLVQLEAREAPLRSVIRDLERALGIGIRMTGDADRTISARYDRVPVERVLAGLGVNYVLVYGRDPATRQPRLARGGISGAGVRPPAPPAPNQQSTGETREPVPPSGDPEPPTQEGPVAVPYTVQEGDTLQSIAMLFIVSQDDIRALNGLAPDQDVRPGQALKIPPATL